MLLPNRFILGILLTSLSLLTGCGYLTSTAAQVTSTPQPAPAASDPALRTLVTRILDNRFLASHSEAIPESPELLVSELPASMPFELPLPEGAVIVGSVVQPDGRPHVRIFLDVPQSSHEAVEFYLTQLQSQGFMVWQPHPTSAVFTGETPEMLLCHQEKGIQLSLSVRETPPEAPADVRLTYDTNPIFVSCDEDIGQMTIYAQTLLPKLTLPAETVLLESGHGGGYEGWAYAEQNFISDLSPAEIDLHLRPQLQAAGWALNAENHTDPVAWSHWTLMDEIGERWTGVLIVTAGQGSENSRVVLFQIERHS